MAVTDRILVTGAQGFQGRYLVAHWLAQDPGATILGVGRSPRNDAAFTHRLRWRSSSLPAPLPAPLRPDDGRYEYRAVDIADAAALIPVLRRFRPTIVVHLAASLRDESWDRLYASNLQGTAALLQAIGTAGIAPPRTVLGSSGSVYGPLPPDQLPAREDAACAPGDLYAASKRAAEDLGRILGERHGTPVIVARLFNLVGPGLQDRHLCAALAGQTAAIRMRLQPPVLEVGPLRTTRDFIDARDAARALHLLAKAGEPGRIYNVGAGLETPVQEIFDAALRSIGAGVEVRRLAGRRSDIPRLFADIGRLRCLGFTPSHRLSESFDEMVAYYETRVATSDG